MKQPLLVNGVQVHVLIDILIVNFADWSAINLIDMMSDTIDSALGSIENPIVIEDSNELGSFENPICIDNSDLDDSDMVINFDDERSESFDLEDESDINDDIPGKVSPLLEFNNFLNNVNCII